MTNIRTVRRKAEKMTLKNIYTYSVRIEKCTLVKFKVGNTTYHFSSIFGYTVTAILAFRLTSLKQREN